ncbi:MAG: hypothetical protein V4568_13265 [Pseudomonadota bacterium]
MKFTKNKADDNNQISMETFLEEFDSTDIKTLDAKENFYQKVNKVTWKKVSEAQLISYTGFLHSALEECKGGELNDVALYRGLLVAYTKLVEYALSNKAITNAASDIASYINVLTQGLADTKLEDPSLQETLLKTVEKVLTYSSQKLEKDSTSLLDIKDAAAISNITRNGASDKVGEIKKLQIRTLTLLDKYIGNLANNTTVSHMNSSSATEQLGSLLRLTDVFIASRSKFGSKDKTATNAISNLVTMMQKVDIESISMSDLENLDDTLKLQVEKTGKIRLEKNSDFKPVFEYLRDFRLDVTRQLKILRESAKPASLAEPQSPVSISAPLHLDNQPAPKKENLLPTSSYAPNQPTIEGINCSETVKRGYDSLNDGVYLNDDVIGILLPELFQNHQENIERFRNNGVSIGYIAPASTRLLFQKGYTDDPDAFTEIDEHDIVFMPLNDSTANVDRLDTTGAGSGSHWELLVYDKTGPTPRFHHYNSKPDNTFANDMVKRIKANIQIHTGTLASDAAEAANVDDKPVSVKKRKLRMPAFIKKMRLFKQSKVIVPHTSPPQANPWDCGMSMLNNINALLSQSSHAFTLQNISDKDHKKNLLTRSSSKEIIFGREVTKLADRSALQHPQGASMHPKLRDAVSNKVTGELASDEIDLKSPPRDCVGKVIYKTEEFMYIEPTHFTEVQFNGKKMFLDNHPLSIKKHGASPSKDNTYSSLPIYYVPIVDRARSEAMKKQGGTTNHLDKLSDIEVGSTIEISMIGKQDKAGSVLVKPFERLPLPGEKLHAPFMTGKDSNGDYVLCSVVPPGEASASNASLKETNLPKQVCKIYQGNLEGTGKSITVLIDLVKKLGKKPWDEWDHKDQQDATVNIPKTISRKGSASNRKTQGLS